jgi:hypothetical protein
MMDWNRTPRALPWAKLCCTFGVNMENCLEYKMIIREDRSRLIKIINEYLHEKITPSEVANKVDPLMDSGDETVVWIAEEFWGYYDDINDNIVIASKEVWDYFQRLLLILDSDASIEIEKRRCFHFTQIPAVLFAVLTGFLYLGGSLGILLGLLFWPVAIIFDKFREHKTQKLYSFSDWKCYPFSSPANILKFHRACRWFKKKRYPKHLEKTKIGRPPSGLISFYIYLSWIVFLPFVFLFQAFPLKIENVNIINSSKLSLV